MSVQSTVVPDPEGGREFPFLLVCSGGFLLALLAGYVNACMLVIFQVPVSHTTGAMTHFGLDLVSRKTDELLIVAAVILAFFCGAVLSGLLIGGPRLRPGRRYGLGLLVEASGLFLAARFSAQGSLLALPAASCVCGLQNGLATQFRGLVLRTTHTTGLITDLGLFCGRRLRGLRGLKRADGNVFLQLIICFGFLVGVIVGGLAVALDLSLEVLDLAVPPTLIAGLILLRWRRVPVREDAA